MKARLYSFALLLGLLCLSLCTKAQTDTINSPHKETCSNSCSLKFPKGSSSFQRGSCGDGIIENYLNCDGEYLDIDREYLERNVFTNVDDDYITCIAPVDSSCTIGESFRTFCTHYPSESAGHYPPGYVHYEQVIGISDFTAATGILVSDEQGEELNWILTNSIDLGYSYSNMNRAIWGILNQISCNSLCQRARSAIVHPTGVISPFLEFYVPLNAPTVQPQLRNDRIIPIDESLIYLCGENKKIDTYVKGLLDQSPSNRYIDIPDPGNIERIVAEVWIEPNECSSNTITSTLGIRADNGNSALSEVSIMGTEIIQTSGSTSIEKVYRYTFEGSHGRISVIPGEDGGCAPSSIAVYVIRPGTEGAALLNTSVNRKFHNSDYEFTMGIGAAPLARDLQLKVPIHEIGNNGRIAQIRAWYTGSPIFSGETSMATAGLEASLIEMVIPNVPAHIDSLHIKVISPGTNGESFGVGSISISSAFSCCANIFQTVNAPICEGEYVTLPDGSTTNTEGIYIDTFMTLEGCDSIITTEVIILPNYLDTIQTAICDGDSYTLPDGTVTSTAGTYSTSLLTSFGCDSVLTTILNLMPNWEFNSTVILCQGDQYTLPSGQVVSSADTYSDTLVSSAGCDSIINTVVRLIPLQDATLQDTICDGDTYILPAGSVVNSPGTYFDTLQAITGCDSIIEIHLTVMPSYNILVSHTLCEGESYTLPNGYVVTQAGTYVDSFTTEQGCDSVLSTVLFVVPNYSSYTSIELCEGDVYWLPDGSLVDSNGIFTDSLTSFAGCDSIVQTETIFYPTWETTILDTICPGAVYILPTGDLVTGSGSYTDSLLTGMGCDSIIHTIITAHPVFDTTISATICEGDSYTLPDGSVADTSGTYVTSYLSNAGCDSTITVLLTVFPSYEAFLTVTACQGETYVLPGGNQISNAGIYTDSLTTIDGCDSIVTIQLILLENIHLIDSIAICEGESYTLPDEIEVIQEGAYIDSFLSADGCDSIITTVLHIIPTTLSMTIDSICQGDSYILPGGVVVNEPGVYVDTLTSQSGCDSMVTTTLITLESFDRVIEDTICAAEQYLLPWGIYTDTSGHYTESYLTEQFCDSIIRVHLTVMPEQNFISHVTLCPGQTYILPDGTSTDHSGTFVDSFQTVFGCDSVHTVVVVVAEEYDILMEYFICEETSIQLPTGELILGDTTIVHLYNTANGCDSAVTQTVGVIATTYNYVEEFICQGDSVMVGDHAYYETYIYTDTLTGQLGCDSIVFLDLVATDPFLATIDTFMCPGSALMIAGETFDAAGHYTLDFLNEFGCDSIYEIDLKLADHPQVIVRGDTTVMQGAEVEAYTLFHTDRPLNFEWYISDTLVLSDVSRFVERYYEPTEIKVQVQDTNSCHSSDIFRIEIKKSCPEDLIFVPNVITPNNDGFNEFFTILNPSHVSISEVAIFNRWGEIVHHATNFDDPWNGTFRGKSVDPAVYTYFIQGDCSTGGTLIKKGNITLLK
ncbi:MAG: T9SS type B sorting domain-containing protein [Bacteroidetes bacterium]|nr:T9SS type B sorting domain-containing protein [Bacteroidota bacterium]